MRTLLGLTLLLSVFSLLADTISVTTKPLEQIWENRRYDAPAAVVSLNAPQLSAEIDAVVIDIPVKVGDLVNQNDLLVELDCQKNIHQQKIIAAELQRSTSQLGFARSQLSRAKNLKSKKSISDELLDQRSTELRVAQSDQLTQQQRLSLADIDVAHCQVRSPFRAVVSDRLISKGAYATKGTPLLALIHLDEVEVKVRLLYSEIQSLRKASSIRLRSQGQTFPLTLRTVLPVFDKSSATAESRLIFSTPDRAWPGAVGRLEWDSDIAVLPASYIVRRDGKLGVFHVVGQKAKFHVLPNAVEGRPVEVDLPADSLIVVEGRQRIQDGDTLSQ